MSAPKTMVGRPALQPIVGGQGVFSMQTAPGVASQFGDTASLSARALLALAPHVRSRRYWLIDPLPTIWEVAVGAPLTPDRLGHLRLAAEALSRQVRDDDGVGCAIIAALDRQLRDAEQTAAEVISALRAAGDPERAGRLVEELRTQQTCLIALPRLQR
jgi:hypothetical protein